MTCEDCGKPTGRPKPARGTAAKYCWKCLDKRERANRARYKKGHRKEINAANARRRAAMREARTD